MRAAKWAPTRCVWADTLDPFYGQPLDQIWRVAGHKREWKCQPRHIKWRLISKLRMSPFSRPLENHWEVILHLKFPCLTVSCQALSAFQLCWLAFQVDKRRSVWIQACNGANEKAALEWNTLGSKFLHIFSDVKLSPIDISYARSSTPRRICQVLVL